MSCHDLSWTSHRAIQLLLHDHARIVTSRLPVNPLMRDSLYRSKTERIAHKQHLWYG